MPQNSFACSALKIEELTLSVRLGCSKAERSKTQEVRVSVEIRFLKCPKGALTDSLNDTICYATVSEAIKRHCESREFHLVERMGYDIYGLVREIVGSTDDLGISVHKMHPPVENLRGGVIFRCGDFVT
ncbi:MAG: dihydroneopterin aldolase [Bdellovibrionales bacterium]|nr:dihydroneopterin aldolase [Bdellovibrionales bacterium]